MIVILTALNVERDAVLEHLVDVKEHHHAQGTVFDIGVIAGHPHHRVAVGVTGPGTTTAAVLTERAKAEFSPAAMLFIGVAGGLKDWLAIGDVVVATKVYSYQGGRSEDDGFRVSPRSWEISHRLEQAARRLPRRNTWYEFLPEEVRLHGPAVEFGPIAVGDVVLDSATSPIARRISESYNDSIAVEMEGSGFAHAAALNDQLPVAVIRGVSDRADGTKDLTDQENNQPIAARNAAAFAVALAAALEPRPAPSGEDASAATDTPVVHSHNTARDNARVGLQVGVNFGGITENRGRR